MSDRLQAPAWLTEYLRSQYNSTRMYASGPHWTKWQWDERTKSMSSTYINPYKELES